MIPPTKKWILSSFGILAISRASLKFHLTLALYPGRTFDSVLKIGQISFPLLDRKNLIKL